MTYIVAEPCIKCKYTDCVSICPVMCFYEGANCVVIDPDECIDCNACVPVCPVDAIYADDEVPEKWAHYYDWNDYLSRQWKEMGYNIVEMKEHPEDAEEWETREKSEEDILTWDV